MVPGQRSASAGLAAARTPKVTLVSVDRRSLVVRVVVVRLHGRAVDRAPVVGGGRIPITPVSLDQPLPFATGFAPPRTLPGWLG